MNTRNLKSSSKALLLEIPHANKRTYGDRSFRVNGAKIWNELPDSIRSVELVTEFKKNLKAYLFTESYGVVDRTDNSQSDH